MNESTSFSLSPSLFHNFSRSPFNRALCHRLLISWKISCRRIQTLVVRKSFILLKIFVRKQLREDEESFGCSKKGLNIFSLRRSLKPNKGTFCIHRTRHLSIPWTMRATLKCYIAIVYDYYCSLFSIPPLLLPLHAQDDRCVCCATRADCALYTHRETNTTVSSRYNLRVNDALRVLNSKQDIHTFQINLFVLFALLEAFFYHRCTASLTHVHTVANGTGTDTFARPSSHAHRTHTHADSRANSVGMARIASNMVRLRFKPLCICQPQNTMGSRTTHVAFPCHRICVCVWELSVFIAFQNVM